MSIAEDKLWQFATEKLGNKPKHIDASAAGGEYHEIYVITAADDSVWYLRVARPALREVKTKNEVACLKWAEENVKSCPSPRVLAWDASAETSVLGVEYSLIEGLPGKTLDDVWTTLPWEALDNLAEQSATLFVEMAQHPMDKIGGLSIENGEIVPGPVIEEIGYELHTVKAHFNNTGLGYEDLQIGGPFDTMADYFMARLRRDLAVVYAHESCTELRTTVAPIIEKLIDIPRQVKDSINAKPLVLAHEDYHMGNMLFDTVRSQLTGVIDWEFACVKPIDQWVRRNTFVSLKPGADVAVKRIRERFYEKVRELDSKIYDLAYNVDPFEDKLLTIVSLSFWIVHCTVTDTQDEDRRRWLQSLNSVAVEYNNLVSN